MAGLLEKFKSYGGRTEKALAKIEGKGTAATPAPAKPKKGAGKLMMKGEEYRKLAVAAEKKRAPAQNFSDSPEFKKMLDAAAAASKKKKAQSQSQKHEAGLNSYYGNAYKVK